MIRRCALIGVAILCVVEAGPKAPDTFVFNRGSPHVLGCIEDYLAGKRCPLSTITTDPTVYEPEVKA